MSSGFIPRYSESALKNLGLIDHHGGVCCAAHFSAPGATSGRSAPVDRGAGELAVIREKPGSADVVTPLTNVSAQAAWP